MARAEFPTRPAFAAQAGSEIGVSDWLEVTQARIDAFAAATDDHQFIHVDPDRAQATLFGATVAHGFLTLSLLSRMAQDVLPQWPDRAMGINYGFDKVRFLSPVKAGARIRGRFTLLEARARSATEWLTRYAVTVDIENEIKPALVAEWLTMGIYPEGTS